MRDLTSFTMIHGSITATVIFLIWVHLLACILLYGAEFTVSFAALRREGDREEPPLAPEPDETPDVEEEPSMAAAEPPDLTLLLDDVDRAVPGGRGLLHRAV